MNEVTFTGSLEQFQDKMVKWLRDTAIGYAVKGRTAKLKGTQKASIAQRDALEAAANHIATVKINRLPKQNKCPNCGHEML